MPLFQICAAFLSGQFSTGKNDTRLDTLYPSSCNIHNIKYEWPSHSEYKASLKHTSDKTRYYTLRIIQQKCSHAPTSDPDLSYPVEWCCGAQTWQRWQWDHNLVFFSPVPVFPKVSVGKCLYSSFGYCLSLYRTTQFSSKLNFKLQGESVFQFQFKKHCQNAIQTCSLGLPSSWHILWAWSFTAIKMSLAQTVFLHLRDVLCEMSDGGHRLAREPVKESQAHSSANYI